MDFSRFKIAVVIPVYHAEKEIQAVLAGIPGFVKHILVVDDASPDSSADLVAAASQQDERILLIRHELNQGVGGAMVTGFKKALELGIEIVIKLDSDGQMDPRYIPALITPLITGEADYAKGNRFRDFEALRQMPLIRRFGNLGLSFLTKAATGYWNVFDPTNGYFAIRTDVLAQLPLEKIDKGYFFETSMLSRLYLLDAYVQDVTIPARYRGEVSNLSIQRVLFEFPYKLTRTLIKRLIVKYFIYDFSMISIYLLTGLPLLVFGLIFGITKWIQYVNLGVAAPTGTVMLPTLSVLLAIQFLLSAIEIDLKAAPRKAISKALV